MTPQTVERFVGTERQATGKDVLALAQEHGVRMVDFKFTDLPGTWQHLGLSIHSLDEEAFDEGLGFDGSSIRGFQEIAESDMVLLPDPTSAVIDPFHEQKTMSIVCNVIDPITREAYSRDPRYIARKAEEYLISTGIADTCFMGPEAEFYVFDHVAFDQRANTAFYEVDSVEAYWNMGQGFGAARNGQPNLGYKLRSQEGYFPAPPGDTIEELFTFNFRPGDPLETNCAVADVRDGSAEIWSSLKSPIWAQEQIATSLGIPLDKTTVHVTEGGGSFGRHLFCDAAFEAAWISKQLGKPVRLMWHRTDSFRHGRVHPMATSRVRVVHNPRRLNIGGIYKAGVQAARGDYVFLVPGDNEMRVDEIVRGLKYLDQADLVVFYVTNVGVRPTLYENYGITIESHILDFDSNVYGDTVRLYFHALLRREQQFRSAVELTRQIRDDIERSRRYFLRHPIQQ